MTTIMKNILLFSCLILTMFSCAVEGDEISGIWFTNGELGKMKVHIKASNGTFVGHLLEYEENGTLVSGKEKQTIFKGLRYKDNKYLGGSFMKSPKGNNPCGFRLAFNTEKKESLKAAYNCNGANRLEYWYRDKYHDKVEISNNVSTISLDDLLKANTNNKDK